MIKESLWVEESQNRWLKLGYVPQNDVLRFCDKYVPALIRSAPEEAKRIQVALSYIGRTGVHWTHELLNWEIAPKPPDEQIIVVTNCMTRAAMGVSAKSRIRGIYYEIGLKG